MGGTQLPEAWATPALSPDWPGKGATNYVGSKNSVGSVLKGILLGESQGNQSHLWPGSPGVGGDLSLAFQLALDGSLWACSSLPQPPTPPCLEANGGSGTGDCP